MCSIATLRRILQTFKDSGVGQLRTKPSSSYFSSHYSTPCVSACQSSLSLHIYCVLVEHYAGRMSPSFKAGTLMFHPLPDGEIASYLVPRHYSLIMLRHMSVLIEAAWTRCQRTCSVKPSPHLTLAFALFLLARCLLLAHANVLDSRYFQL